MAATLSAASATVVVMSNSSSSKVWSRKNTMAVSVRPSSAAPISSELGSCGKTKGFGSKGSRRKVCLQALAQPRGITTAVRVRSCSAAQSSCELRSCNRAPGALAPDVQCHSSSATARAERCVRAGPCCGCKNTGVGRACVCTRRCTSPCIPPVSMTAEQLSVCTCRRRCTGPCSLPVCGDAEQLRATYERARTQPWLSARSRGLTSFQAGQRQRCRPPLIH